jgi:hypothetical protein
MGFETNTIKLLLKAKELGVNFEKVITIGRQGLHLKENELQDLLVKSGFSSEQSSKIFKNNNFAEPFLKLLGAKITDSMDASSYEGATIIHDLNQPIANQLKSKYTLVIDGGSLEHVFNFPMAIKNCMQLVETGGYIISIAPANNFFGHGFYQFSPELFFRIFNASNGYRSLKMYFFIEGKESEIYEVSDPLEVNQRVTMVNSSPSYLFVIAQKTEEKELFEQTPMQSDYENISWQNKTSAETVKKFTLFGFVKQFVPSFIKTWILKLFRPTGISNQDFFKKL